MTTYKYVWDHNQGKYFEAIELNMISKGYELVKVEIRYDGKKAWYVYVFRIEK